MPFHDPAKPLAQCYDEDMELVVRADQLGIHEFWVGEHHTMATENIMMPEIFISAAMRETSNIRMGPAPVCLQLHHPVAVASRLAFLDHFTKGRLNLCFGAGTIPSDIEIFGVNPTKGTAMVAEATDMILELWSAEAPLSIHGEFWNISIENHVDKQAGLGVLHKPYQLPHPPIAMPISSLNSSTAKVAGRRGFQPFGHCVITSRVLANIWQTYARSASESSREPNRSDYKVARPIFLADTTAEAVEKARNNSISACFKYIAGMLDRGSTGRIMMKGDPNMPDSDCNLDYWMDEQIIAGDVNEVLRRLESLVEETGGFGTLVMMSYDWDDKEAWVHSLELFANELMPALNKAIGAVPA